MAASRKRRDAGAEEVSALARLRLDPLTGDDLAALRRAVCSHKALVVAKAAGIAAERGRRDLIKDLEAAFAWLLVSGAERDPGCSAKLAIARALVAFETEDPSVYLAGVRHAQREPVWGGQVDTAGALRGTCLQGLVAMGSRDALFEAVPLLVDTRVETRRLAVEALGMLRMDESELLLRLKIAGGDEEPLVLADAFGALMAVNPERSLGFVAPYLELDGSADPDVARGAALAIGESRHPEAFRLLREVALRTRFSAARDRLLLPMALTRSEPAFEYLLALVASAGGDPQSPQSPEADDSAVEAVAALRMFKADEGRRARIEAALAQRGNALLARAFED